MQLACALLDNRQYNRRSAVRGRSPSVATSGIVLSLRLKACRPCSVDCLGRTIGINQKKSFSSLTAVGNMQENTHMQCHSL